MKRAVRLIGIVVALGLVASGLGAAQAASVGASLEIDAPSQVKVGEPIQLKVVVRDGADIAGYETRLRFDTRVAEFDGLLQRQNDVKASGRDVAALGPVVDTDGVSFGQYSCPAADCLQRGSARHGQGSRGRLVLATASVTPRQAGTLELSLGQTKVVDASGQTVSVQGSETTVRVQVGGGGPLYGAPVAGPRPSGKVSQQAPGPFDLSKDGVVDHADSVLVALGWTQLRQQGVVCGPRVDPTLDVNHDGCLDVADAQLIASHFGESAPKALPAADAPTLADAVSADEADDGSELSVATVGDVVALAAPLLEVVNTTDDTDDVTPGDGVCRTAAGNCSLRAAIQEANAHGGPVTIDFNIPGSGLVEQITAPTGLPAVTNANTTIDGYSQSGARPNSDPNADNAQLTIEIDGPGGTNQQDGLTLASANNTVRGLAIVGYDVSIKLFSNAAQGNRVVGNFAGTNAAATLQPPAVPGAAGTSGAGVSLISAAHNQVGDVSAADRNVVSGNTGSGVAFFDEGAENNTIYNNLIGLHPSGVGHLLNTKHGVDVNAPASFNVIGGLGAGQRNVIGGNLENGIEYSHNTLTVENQAVGNYIGTDVSGNAAPSELANGGFGVHIHDGPTNNTVSDNVIGNSVQGGIFVHDFNNWGNRITNNKVGIGSQGGAIPNQQFGIEVGLDATNVTIGPGNIVANNPDGILVPNATTTGVTITRNSIFNNVSIHSCSPTPSGRGIDLAPLDPCDPNGPGSPSPANNGIVGPTLLAANSSTVSAQTCAGCRVEVFVADQFGQGRSFVGTGVADASGHALVSVSGLAAGNVITATTTDTKGDTSEFAASITVGNGSVAAPAPTSPPASLPVALDTFSRVVTNGWGTANAGGTWATEPLPTHNAGDPFPEYNVNGSVGSMTLLPSDPVGQFRSAYLTDVSARDVDVTYRVTVDSLPPSGGFLFNWVALRRIGSGTGSEYFGRITLAPSGVTLSAWKSVDTVNPPACTSLPCAPILIAGENAAHVQFAPGNFLRVHAQVMGANPTTIRLRAWNDGQPEPTTWAVQTTDSEPALQGAGSVGLRSFVAGTPTHAINFVYDDFQAVSSDSAPTPTPTATPTATPLPGSFGAPTATPRSQSVQSSTGTGGGGGGGNRGGGGGGGGAAAPAPVGGGPGFVAPIVAPVPAPAPATTPTPTVPIAVAGVTAIGPVASTTFDANGGQLTLPNTSVSIVAAADSLNGRSIIVRLVRVDTTSLPSVPTAFNIGSTGASVTIEDAATGQPVTDLAGPLTLTSTIDDNDVQTAGGNVQRVRWATVVNGAWQALPCSAQADTFTLTCSLSNSGVFAVVIAPQSADVQDWDLPNGHFYLQTNGFSGAGNLGYAVTDDDAASFWTEFQRLGGVQVVGYPITGRFEYRGFTTQAFQKLALQWRPDLGVAVPVNVMDELNQRGSDTWLDQERQVPLAADTSGDTGLDFPDVVSRHIALLDPYPELADYYNNMPDALDRFGLPLSVKDYGPFVAVRLQRAALQLWKVDSPSAAAGSVVAANGSDLAKEIGLWPQEADAVSAAPAPPLGARTQ